MLFKKLEIRFKVAVFAKVNDEKLSEAPRRLRLDTGEQLEMETFVVLSIDGNWSRSCFINIGL